MMWLSDAERAEREAKRRAHNARLSQLGRARADATAVLIALHSEEYDRIYAKLLADIEADENGS